MVALSIWSKAISTSTYSSEQVSSSCPSSNSLSVQRPLRRRRYNNNLGYDEGWEAGGMKFVVTRGWGAPLRVARNTVVNNFGPGIWTDCDSIGLIYEDNIVMNNSAGGIFHEISFGAVRSRATGRRPAQIRSAPLLLWSVLH